MAEAVNKFDEFPVVSASSGAKPEDKFAGFPIVEPSFGDKAKAFMQGAAGAGVESTAMLTGTALGAGAGLSIGGPVGGAAMGALGAAAGHEAGRMMRQTPRVEDMAPGVRAYGYAGEVVGGGLPFAMAPLGAAAAGARVAQTGGFGGFINRMIEMAGSSPKSFMASEVAGLSGAAIGSGVAETVAPGKTLPRVGAEIAGGFFNPTRVVLGTFGAAIDGVKSVVGSLSKAGTENRAAKLLQDIVRDAGEDPAKVAAALRASGLPGIELTSAQKSGSPALAAIEKKLSEDSVKFGAEAQKRGDEAMSSIKDMMVALRATGDPNAIKAAADIREKYFRALIAGRLQIAEREATEAAGRISSQSPKDRASISKQADELLQGALKEVRAVERELWSNIPRDVKAGTQNLTAKYAELKNELLPNETLPSVIEGYVKTLTKEGAQGSILGADGKPLRSFAIGSATGETTSGDLLRFRSRALELSRDAMAAGNSGDARRYGMLAEAALDDLTALPAMTQGLSEARAFSRELHDTFTRTFAGDATAVGKGGKDRIPPELTMRFALGGGKEQGALRLRQIEEAAKFLPSRGLGGAAAEANANQIVALQNQFLRVAASESVDPNTGRVSVSRVSKFIRDNGELLDRFPAVKADLTKALSSETSLQDLQRTLTGATKVIEQKAAFAQFSKMENPADVVRAAVTGKSPVSDLNEMAKLAKRGGAPAVDGLRATVWDDAIRRATDASGNVSAERLYQNMFRPVGPNQPSLINIMHDQGIITRKDMVNAETLFKEYQKVQSAMAKGTNLDKLAGDIDPLFDMAARMAGVHAASLIAPKGPGAIVAAGRASAYARNLFEKVPMARMQDVLVQAALDPKFAAMLLEKPATKAAGLRLGTQIHAYMFQAGLTALDGE